jgi:serine/threonine-protein kinase
VADFTPRILAGRYEVGELIGRGGMAEVHVGRDTRLGRTVAIKLLRSDLARDPSFQTRFRREAQAAASLNHPAIVSVYDTGEDVVTDAAGVTHHLPFIIMEYVEGHTLRELMHDGTALPIDEATDITIGVLSALQYAHHAGIVHRDIKPGNIMLTAAGQVKVMDFGIARALAETSDSVTQTQAVIGTAQYLSPEQARGENVDARSDLYSTGCVLFELLTGRPPFQGDSAVAVAYQHVREYPVPPSAYAPDVPAVLDQIVIKALTKDRNHRYATASEFLADLQASKHGGRVSAPPVMPVTDDATQVISPATSPTLAVPPASFPPPPAPPGASPFNQAGILPNASRVAEQEAADRARRRKRITIISVIAGLLVVALAIVAILMLRDREPDPGPTGPTGPATAVVPKVPTSRSVADAVAALEDLELKAEEGTPETSESVPKGQVTRFDPATGQSVKVGDTVKYFVSLGPSEVTVPDVAGLTQDEARKKLLDANLKPAIATKSVDDARVPADRVVGTDPAFEAPVTVGQEVTLLVSTGKTKVPDCAGKTQAECSDILSTAGLRLGDTKTEVSDSVEAGKIIRTEPAKDQILLQNSPVVAVIAEAPKQVTVPDVTNWDVDAAKAHLVSLGLKVEEQRSYDPNIGANQVIRTEPGPGDKLNAGDTIILVISRGPDPASPPPSPPTN